MVGMRVALEADGIDPGLNISVGAGAGSIVGGKLGFCFGSYKSDKVAPSSRQKFSVSSV